MAELQPNMTTEISPPQFCMLSRPPLTETVRKGVCGWRPRDFLARSRGERSS